MGNAFFIGDTADNAFANGYDRVSKSRSDRARLRAGQAMALGDTQGAAGELFQGGELDAGRTLQNDQRQQEQQAYERQRQDTQDTAAKQQRTLGFMKDAATALLEVPPEERANAYRNSIAPHLVRMGLDQQAVEEAAQHLDDASLRAFGGQIDQHLQVINRGSGGYDVVDTRTGKAVRSVAPDPRIVSVANGATLYDPETRQPVYSSPKTFAPQRPRSGGGGGGAPQAPVASRQIGGKTYYKVNGEWYDNPEGH